MMTGAALIALAIVLGAVLIADAVADIAPTTKSKPDQILRAVLGLAAAFILAVGGFAGLISGIANLFGAYQ